MPEYDFTVPLTGTLSVKAANFDRAVDLVESASRLKLPGKVNYFGHELSDLTVEPHGEELVAVDGVEAHLLCGDLACLRPLGGGRKCQHCEPAPQGDGGAPSRPAPDPGTAYDFTPAAIAHAAALLLGGNWQADAAPWGLVGYLETRDRETRFTIGVDGDGDLFVRADLDECEPSPDAGGGEQTTHFPDFRPTDGLKSLAIAVAEVVRNHR